MSTGISPATPLAVIRNSSAVAFADMRVIYSWKSWTFGWLGRMLAQVTFFVMLGNLLQSPDTTRFLVIGNSVMTCVVESMLVIASTTWERWAGTLPLLAAAPADVGWVFVGRSLQWPLSGCATSLVSLFALGPLFGAPWRPAQVLPLTGLVVLTAAATYCFGLFAAALVLEFSAARNVVSNALYLAMMAFCGVQVPVDFWPPAVRWCAWTVPLTHTLSAIRAVYDGAGGATVAREALIGAALGALWLVAARYVFRLVFGYGRRIGTLDFNG